MKKLFKSFTLAGTPCLENLADVAQNAKTVVEAPCLDNLADVVQNAKTVVEAPCSENLKGVARCAFTLAEVLIVIGVIGVVSAITIPSLINTISEKAKERQTKTIEARLFDGINRYSATEDGLSQNYNTTYDFLAGLSKHYKMTQICKADEMTKCFQ